MPFTEGLNPNPLACDCPGKATLPLDSDSWEGGHVSWLQHLCLDQGAGHYACGLADRMSEQRNE